MSIHKQVAAIAAKLTRRVHRVASHAHKHGLRLVVLAAERERSQADHEANLAAWVADEARREAVKAHVEADRAAERAHYAIQAAKAEGAAIGVQV